MTEPSKLSPEVGRHVERVLRHHRSWMRRRGLLDRPWLIFGSAPQPTVPLPLPDEVALVCVKYAGHSARQVGLRSADLSFILKKTTPDQIRGLALGNILRMARHPTWQTRLSRLTGFRGQAECQITNKERDWIIIRELGSLYADLGKEGKPSNGVGLICYAIALGIPRIIVAGISLEKDGYEYDPNARTRRHLPEDRAALRQIASSFPQVVTSEPELHRLSGLALHTG